MSQYFGGVFAHQRVVAILRSMTPARALAVAEQAWDLGIGVVEVGPFPVTRFVVTGGTDAHNAMAFLVGVARPVGVGGGVGRCRPTPLLAALTPRTSRNS